MEVISSKKHRLNFNKSDKFLENLQWNNPKVEFKYFENHEGPIVYVNSSSLNENNYRVTLNGTTLSLIIYERREILKPTFIEVLNKTIHNKSAYERLKSFKYKLPEGIFRIDKTIWNKEKMRLEIQLIKYSSIKTKN